MIRGSNPAARTIFVVFLFLPRDARNDSAVLLSYDRPSVRLSVRPSVRPSVTSMYRGHIDWTSSQLTAGPDLGTVTLAGWRLYVRAVCPRYK